MSFLPGRQDRRGRAERRRASRPSCKIMAGLDQPSNGEAFLQPGATVGILMQEPTLNEEKTVLGNVEEGLGEIKAQARPVQRDRRADGHRLLRRAHGGDGRAAGGPRPRRRLGPRLSARAGDGRAALPAAGRAGRRTCPVASAAGSRCASCCCASPTCCCSTSRPTTSTPRGCCGSSSTSRPTRARCWRSPTTATSSTTSPSGSSRSTAAAPTPTRATTPPTWRRRPSGSRSRAGRTPSCRSGCVEELAWVRSGAKATPGEEPARVSQRYEEMATEAERHRKLDFEEIQIPPARGWATSSSRSRTWTRASTAGC